MKSIESGGQFRSKTLTLKNKNKIFPKFLSPYSTLIYKISILKNSQFLGSNLHIALIMEALLF